MIYPVTSMFDVPLMVARGYASLSFLHSAAEYINQLDIPTYIYHLGDFDPSGVNAGEKIEETLNELAPDAEIFFERIAVTPEQIEHWDLPTRPTKTSDTRAKNFGAISRRTRRNRPQSAAAARARRDRAASAGAPIRNSQSRRAKRTRDHLTSGQYSHQAATKMTRKALLARNIAEVIDDLYCQHAPHSWVTPDESLLEDRRGELPEFPCDVFPPSLSSWLLRATRGAGVRIDHIAVPMLGVASSLIGKARRVQASTSWIEPTTIWACIVGQSGDRKTPGLRVILRALDRIEAENSPAQREAEHTHLLRAEKAKAALKAWRKACQQALTAKPPREPPPMPIEAVDPGAFIYPALYVTDSTIQRLAKLCEVRPRGMMQIRDELSGLFTGMARQSGARSFYLECWNGEKHVVERVDSARSFIVPNLLVGIIGGFQPDKLARAFTGDEDGMYARFLFGWPATPAYARLTDDVEEVDPVFQGVLTKLIRLPDEDESGQFAPRTISLSHAARARFEDYRVWVDGVKRGLEGREQQWLVKSESQALRLASTLTYLVWASLDDGSDTGVGRINAGMEPDAVPEFCMVAATQLLREYFWPHARAALRQIGLTDRYRHLRRAAAVGQGQWPDGGLAQGRPPRSLGRRSRCRTDPRFAGSTCDGGVAASRKNRNRGATARAMVRESTTIRDCRNCPKRRKSPTVGRLGAFRRFLRFLQF